MTTVHPCFQITAFQFLQDSLGLKNNLENLLTWIISVDYEAGFLPHPTVNDGAQTHRSVVRTSPIAMILLFVGHSPEGILEKEMATHSSILAWRIPWTEEPGRLQPMGSQRVGNDWVTFTLLLHQRVWVLTTIPGFQPSYLPYCGFIFIAFIVEDLFW